MLLRLFYMDISKQKIFKEIEKKDAVKILSDMVSIPSYDSEKYVVEYLIQRMEKLGIKYKLTEVAPERHNLIAEIGEGKKSLILNSHTDTVSPGDTSKWTNHPLRLTQKNDLLYGLGSCDAKGSLVAMLVAFESIFSELSSLNGRLILQAVCCEETRGRGTLAEAMQGLNADSAIIGEPTELVPMIGHKGGLGLEVETFGKPAHASSPEEGINAISNMANIIKALDKLAQAISNRNHPLFGKASLAITQIHGGRATNVIPDQCAITIDRRLIPDENIIDAQKEIEDIIEIEKKSNPNLIAIVNKKIGIDPCLISPEEPIVQTVINSVYEVKDKRPNVTGFQACCDMWCLVHHSHIPTVILGPGKLSMAHKVDEYISIKELYDAAKIYATIAINWLNKGR